MSEELLLDESPYRPPDAELQPAREPLQRGLGDSPDGPDPTRIDLERALRYPFTNPEWWKTALIIGVLQFVPLVGIVVQYGWLQRIFDAVRAGSDEQMPSVSVGDDLSRGWKPLGTVFVGGMVLTLIMWIVMMLPVLLAAMVGAVLGEDSAGPVMAILGMASMFPVLLGMVMVYLMGPELLRRCLCGDWFGMLRWRQAVQTIKAAPVPYLTLLATLLIALMGMYAGMFALYIGFLITVPLGMAVAMHGLAQWHRHLEHLQADGLD